MTFLFSRFTALPRPLYRRAGPQRLSLLLLLANAGLAHEGLYLPEQWLETHAS